MLNLHPIGSIVLEQNMKVLWGEDVLDKERQILSTHSAMATDNAYSRAWVSVLQEIHLCIVDWLTP